MVQGIGLVLRACVYKGQYAVLDCIIAKKKVSVAHVFLVTVSCIARFIEKKQCMT